MKMKITYQGVAGAYSNIAAMQVFPEQDYLPCEADLAMIPVENSNAGRVSDVHFLLPKTGLHIVGEHFLRIEHQLLGLPGARLEDIRAASSHPQALAQCSAFLKAHGIKPMARIDTAKSCEDVLAWQDKSKAAPNIENAANNTTRFLIMSRDETVPEDDGGKFITSFIFKLKNIPAALYKALGGFATNGINMTKLESYLLDGKFVSAQFYAEIEAHPAQQAFKNAFDELRFFSDYVHVLGTYSSARDRM